METKYVNDPSLLEESGFKDNSPSSTDYVRTILYEKKIGELELYLRVEFTLTIFDNPLASYKENHQIDFENIVIIDSLGNKKQTDMTSVKEIKRFLELVG